MTGGDGVDLSVIVVNWNTADLLDACLRSIRDHGIDELVTEVIVVDNGSDDGSAALVRAQWPDVTLIANQDNEGYTRANNVAIRRSAGRHLLLINADAMLTPGCLERLLARLQADTRAAVVGPRLVFGDGTFQRWTAGCHPTLVSTSAYLLLLERVSARARARTLYLAEDTRTPFQPDWVSSACMLVRRAALDTVGLLDERYFCYMDDVDLCARVRAAGWTVWYEPAATSVHLMGQATRRRTGSASPAALRNFNDYFRRQHGSLAGWLLQAMEVIGFAARAVAYAAGAATRRGDGLAQARAHARNLRVSLQRGHV